MTWRRESDMADGIETAIQEAGVDDDFEGLDNRLEEFDEAP